jgi:hypothetical protein
MNPAAREEASVSKGSQDTEEKGNVRRLAGLPILRVLTLCKLPHPCRAVNDPSAQGRLT